MELRLESRDRPAFESIAPSFIEAMCAFEITCFEPVAVTNTSPSGAASAIGITVKPS